MNLPYICGMTFAPFAHAGKFSSETAKQSLKIMKENTGANMVIFAPGGIQETAQSEEISYRTEATMTDDELKEMIEYAHNLGFRVALKPTVNCQNGTWRAHINFFDEDVPCEPKWSNWFESYSSFQCHYAAISQENGCEMHIAGCEMVMSEHREEEWRQIIKDIRGEFKGIVSYNTDKYQEHNVNWWDCVDVISSSGYYPMNDWENQLDRIEKVVAKFQKPFFFAETGCMSTAGASKMPNNWKVWGDIRLNEQAEWFSSMFTACTNRPWVRGFAIWAWPYDLYPLSEVSSHGGYDIYGKPAEKIVKGYYDMYRFA